MPIISKIDGGSLQIIDRLDGKVAQALAGYIGGICQELKEDG